MTEDAQDEVMEPPEDSVSDCGALVVSLPQVVAERGWGQVISLPAPQQYDLTPYGFLMPERLQDIIGRMHNAIVREENFVLPPDILQELNKNIYEIRMQVAEGHKREGVMVSAVKSLFQAIHVDLVHVLGLVEHRENHLENLLAQTQRVVLNLQMSSDLHAVGVQEIKETLMQFQQAAQNVFHEYGNRLQGLEEHKTNATPILESLRLKCDTLTQEISNLSRNLQLQVEAQAC